MSMSSSSFSPFWTPSIILASSAFAASSFSGLAWVWGAASAFFTVFFFSLIGRSSSIGFFLFQRLL